MEIMMQRESKRSGTGDDDAVVESPLHGDVLELILSHVPLIDLVPSRRVSRSWRHAVSSSLRHLNRPRPWLVAHTQATRPPYVTAARAFDPRSRVWVEIRHRDRDPPARIGSSLLCSQSGGLLYAISISQLSFSTDPLGLSWHHVDPPRVWRSDPIVAAVGPRVVVAGGGCDFYDDPLAVEIYHLETRKWESCDAMPPALRDCSATACLSVAVGRGRMYVAEKISGEAHSFNPETKEWRGPYYLRPDHGIYLSSIGFVNDKLILIGLIDDGTSVLNPSRNVKSVKIWEVVGEFAGFREMTEMPPELLKQLKGVFPIMSSITFCSSGDMMYLHDPTQPEVVIWCEVAVDSAGYEWGSLRVPAAATGGHRSAATRTEFTCWDAGIPQLERVLATESLTLCAMEHCTKPSQTR